LISLDLLVDDGLLTAEDLADVPTFPEDAADFDAAAQFKLPLLRRAAERMRTAGSADLRAALDQFRTDEAAWLEDFAFFTAYGATKRGAPWQKWPDAIRDRDPEALAKARSTLTEQIDAHIFNQFIFYRQWGQLRKAANDHDISLIGDIPIFVALDSSDVWANRDIFSLDEKGNPTVVAGVPPDYFSKTGQRWGNPLYRWDRLAETGYRWWIDRLRATLKLVDIIRVDHFRGFQAYWEVPANRRTAVQGRWVEAPGADFFAAARKELGELPVVVEDLGLITRAVRELRQSLGYPGMRVLQFAFGTGPANIFLPHMYEPGTVVYTGTHDNDTTVGWFASAPEGDRDYARRYLSVSGEDIAWDFIRLAVASSATFAIFPVQDVLSLGTEARMNFPGRPQGNWSWRMREGMLTSDHARRLREMAQIYGRLLTPEDEQQDEEE
jgi:4-alpha-glucanotransferase